MSQCTICGRHWAVRDGQWKLVHGGPATRDGGRNLPAAQDFLSDMSGDVTEAHSLADQYPDMVERLTRLHVQWIKEVEKQ